jgi:hypothetical protein
MDQQPMEVRMPRLHVHAKLLADSEFQEIGTRELVKEKRKAALSIVEGRLLFFG